MNNDPNTLPSGEETGGEGKWLGPLETRPNSVAIVALGPSAKSFTREMMSFGPSKKPFDEVWTLNKGIRAFQHDKLFVMDDLKWIEDKQPEYAQYLKDHKKAIITSTCYDDYPASIEYPYQEVLETVDDDTFSVNTVAYMVAYAIHIRVRNLSIYGADFVYPNGTTAENGGMAVCYLLGMMRHFGLVHRLPGDSTLLYANKVQPHPETGALYRPPYGYHRKGEMQEKAAREEKRKLEQEGKDAP